MMNSHTTAKPFIILLCCQKKGEKCAHRISHKSWRKADVNCGWIKNSGTVFLLADSPLVQDWATQSLCLPVCASWRNTPRSGLQIFDWCTREKVSHLAAKLIPTRCNGGREEGRRAFMAFRYRTTTCDSSRTRLRELFSHSARWNTHSPVLT